MVTLPPYPSTFEEQVKWYAPVEYYIHQCIHKTVLECAAAQLQPAYSSTAVAVITELFREVNLWVETAIDLVNSRESRDPTITTEPVLVLLRQMAADIISRKDCMFAIMKSVGLCI